MWLEELTLSSFKNLRDLTVRFDSSLHTVLVGVNGSGKSNLLEAIVSLFSELHREETAPFSYTVKYRCGASRKLRLWEVRVKSLPSSVDKTTMPRARFYAKNENGHSNFLPRFVFGYYSGASDRFHEYFVEHQRAFYKKLKDPKADPSKLPFRPLFLAKPSHGQFVLLAFYSHEDKQFERFTCPRTWEFLILNRSFL